MDTSTMTKAELDFATLFGTIFSLSTTIEYLVAAGAMFNERGLKYPANKCKDAEASSQMVHDTLLREMVKRLSPEEKAVTQAAIDDHKEFVYSLFLLDAKEQIRVKNLIRKIKLDRK